MEEVKRCPFCGSRAYLMVDKAKRAKLYYIHVKCTECGAQGRTYFTKDNPDAGDIEEAEKAVIAWNQRAGI